MATPPRLLVLVTDELSHLLLRGQLAHLINDGFEVHVGTARHDVRSPHPFDPGVQAHHIGFRRQPAPVADLAALAATAWLIRRLRPDIVVASTPKAGLLGTLAARLCRVPVRVYQVRGLRHETLTGPAARIGRALERLTMRLATQVTFNSASLRAVAEADGLLPAGRGTVIGNGSGNGIDTTRPLPDAAERAAARTALGLPQDAPVIGTVGRLTRDKGIEDLIAVLDTLPPAVHLLLVGPFETGDPLPEGVRARIASDPRIVHHAWLADPRPAYAAIDVCVFCSAREGLPNVPLEAQACGVPVVGYAATGTVDAVDHGHTGVLVPVGDVTALSAALRDLLAHPERWATLGTAAAAWVRARFHQPTLWAEIARTYRAWLQEAAATQR